jgi:predicted amidohydrolase
MKIYCCQFDIAWENKPANFEKVRSLLSAGEIERESLVLLPEMFATGFSMNIAAIAEEEKSATEEFLAQTAREFGMFLMGGVVAEGKHRRGRNEAVLFTPKGEIAARYCKVQPFTLGGESQNYVAGEELIIVPWRGFSLAPFICYDLRFPELFRGAVRRGANLMTVVANWPVTRIQHWVTLLQARAIENQAYVAGVNRCGTDPTLTYNGQSLIVNPAGEIVARAGDGECVISAEVDLKHVTAYRAELPFLKDIRPDYGTLSK